MPGELKYAYKILVSKRERLNLRHLSVHIGTVLKFAVEKD